MKLYSQEALILGGIYGVLDTPFAYMKFEYITDFLFIACVVFIFMLFISLLYFVFILIYLLIFLEKYCFFNALLIA